MASPRFFKLSVERQEEILSLAGQVFAANGFEGASLNRIIGELGISKGSFYYYFTDKADLLARVVEWVTDLLMEEQGAQRLVSLTADTFWTSFAEFMAGKSDYVRDRPWMIDFMKVIYSLPKAQFDEAFHARLGDRGRWLQETLARGQELGVVRTDLPAETLAAICFGAGEAFDRSQVAANPDTKQLLDDLDHLSGLGLDLMRRLVAVPNYQASQEGR